MVDANHDQPSVSSEESGEEMEFEDWRTNRFLRENYLDSIRVICLLYKFKLFAIRIVTL